MGINQELYRQAAIRGDITGSIINTVIALRAVARPLEVLALPNPIEEEAIAERRQFIVETRLIAKLDGLLTTRSAWAAVATTIGTILGVLLAVAAFAGDRFDAGVGMADQRQAQIQRDSRQDEVMRRIDGKLDRIIAAQKK